MFQKIYQKLQTKEGLMLVVSVAIIVAVVGSLCRGVFGPSHGMFPGASGQIPAISVTGTGEVNATPDVAMFSFSISKDASTIAEARNQVALIGNDLIKKLKDASIAEKDIKTEDMSTYPKYENRASTTKTCASPASSGIEPLIACPPVYNSVVVGYTVSINYTVKVRDLDQVSKIATLLTDAKLFSLNGPNFEVDDKEAIADQAQEKAIMDAKAQAKVLAKQLGVRLGKIVDFQINGNGPIAPMYYDRAMMSAGSVAEKSISPDLPTGETKITSQVTITYRIR